MRRTTRSTWRSVSAVPAAVLATSSPSRPNAAFASSVDRNRRLRVQYSSTVARRREWKSATNRLRKYLVVGRYALEGQRQTVRQMFAICAICLPFEHDGPDHGLSGRSCSPD